MLLDGENQCGDELDSWFYFALNLVVSGIHMVFSKYQIFDILISVQKEFTMLLCEVQKKDVVILFKSVTRWACVRNLDLRGLESVLQNRALGLKNCERQQYLEPQNLMVQKVMAQRSRVFTCCTRANVFPRRVHG